MERMTPDERREFLQAGTRTGKLATVRADGRPHVAPIWFVLDGENLYFTTWHESVKAANIRRDPRVAISVDEETPPYHFVIVEGEAAILDPSPEERVAWSTRIARRYMGDELAEQFGKRNGVEGELLIRVTPAKFIAQKNLAD